MTTWKKIDPCVKEEAAKYSRPVPSRELILNTLNEKKSLNREQFIELFNLTSDFEIEAFRRRLIAMVRDGQLFKTRGGKHQIVKPNHLVKGFVIGHRDGFGFVSPEDGSADIYLPPREMRRVFDGDLVSVRIVKTDRKNKREGSIVEIIEQKIQEIVGRFFIERGVGFVEPDNKRNPNDIIIPTKERNGAKSGQIVTAEIITPPTFRKSAVGRIKEILGDYMAPGLEIEVAIRANRIPYIWPSNVLTETEKLSPEISANEIKNRHDIRDLPLITIDGEDAKDFDDAVYCEKNSSGAFKLFVAIADVSHYVKPKSALDIEANERGNSVYFPGKVIPMLPKVLSNELCSLKPNVDRLCMVCEAAIDKDGTVTNYKFYPATMKSQARMTYTNVAKILKGDLKLQKQYKNLLPHINNLKDLYDKLIGHRKIRGALDFDTPEVRVEFGANKKIKNIIPVERNEAHRIIEECMLCANVCAANYLIKNKMPSLFRVHDGPKSDRIQELKIFLGELGLKLGGGELPTPKDFSNLIDKVKERPDNFLIQTVLLRSLQQAIYSPDTDGHFGLAYDNYTHFTSPIRRYPDLIVHRSIKQVLAKQPKKIELNELRGLGEHFSMTERRADNATNDAIAWLKCEYMRDKVGEVFDGIISGVSGFGIFVQIQNIYVDGLIHIKDLRDDYYNFDSIHHRLIGEHSGKIYRLGDKLKVIVENVNLTKKQIDLKIS